MGFKVHDDSTSLAFTSLSALLLMSHARSIRPLWACWVHPAHLRRIDRPPHSRKATTEPRRKQNTRLTHSRHCINASTHPGSGPGSRSHKWGHRSMHPFKHRRNCLAMEVRGPGVSEQPHMQPCPDIDLPSSLVMYTDIYPDTHASILYVAGFAKSVKSYTLHVTTLDLTTGQVIASVNIPASIANVHTDYLLLGPARAASSSTTTTSSGANVDVFGPSLVWLSPSSTASNAPLSIFSAPLSPALKGKVLTIPNTSYKRIQDVDLSGNGFFMAVQDNGTAEILAYETGGSPVRVVWDFGDVVSRIISTRFGRRVAG